VLWVVGGAGWVLGAFAGKGVGMGSVRVSGSSRFLLRFGW